MNNTAHTTVIKFDNVASKPEYGLTFFAIAVNGQFFGTAVLADYNKKYNVYNAVEAKLDGGFSSLADVAAFVKTKLGVN